MNVCWMTNRMACRYKLERAKGRDHYERAIEEDKVLLGAFGAGLLSVGGGIRICMKKEVRTGRINPWDVIEMGPRVWKWARPALIEVLELRAQVKALKVELEAAQVQAATSSSSSCACRPSESAAPPGALGPLHGGRASGHAPPMAVPMAK
jgi:hypothetical protein